MTLDEPTVGSLFSGIGGLDLGLERAGWEIKWQVEIDEWCRRVLEKHWPDVPKYGDVRDVGRHNLEPVDLIVGGFPCQPVSLAGRRQAQADPRWLWPEFIRVVSELRPRFVLVENVPGLLHRGMAEVIGDLSACGYDAEWDCIPAAAVGAPHLRYRVFIVAYPDKQGSQGRNGGVVQERPCQSSVGQGCASMAHPQGHSRQDGQAEAQRQGGSTGGGTPVAYTNGSGRQGRPRLFWTGGRPEPAYSSQWTVEPNVGRVAHGIPSRVDRLRGLGNAVVPQVAEWIGRRLLEAWK